MSHQKLDKIAARNKGTLPTVSTPVRTHSTTTPTGSDNIRSSAFSYQRLFFMNKKHDIKAPCQLCLCSCALHWKVSGECP